MNRFDIQNGGHPLSGDDLKYFQTAVKDTFKGSMECLRGKGPNDVVILNGCVISEGGGNFTHTEGYVWIDGEIYFVPAKVLATPIDTLYSFTVTETVDKVKVYKNASSVNVRFKRICIIQSLNVGTPTSFTDDNRIENLLVFNQKTAWRSVGAMGEPAYEASWSGSAKVRMNKLGKIELGGSATITSMGGTDREIWILDAGDRPLTDKHFVVKGIDNGTDAPILISIIASTGEVKIIGGATSVGKTVYLNPIVYDLD
jgi:hypothetical protein